MKSLASSLKTLLIVGMSAQAVAINIDHAKEETERASSLRGFKPDYIEKLYWTQHQDSGYHHWNNGHDKSDRNSEEPGYSLTVKELLDTALASRNATALATQLAEASVANDYDAVREAVGNLNSAAYLARNESVLACAFLPAEEEEDEEENIDIENLLQNITHVEGIANAIGEAASMTTSAAEGAIVAINAADPVKSVVSSAVFHTKTRADTVVTMVEQLTMMMISNAGGGPSDKN
mmetsp:Transcript_16919/g.25121  ORF Transcript_16919/g.25121 Transcript_16919/m.25121 type:complete len:236 (+) Transcript_16919:3-710(+)